MYFLNVLIVFSFFLFVIYCYIKNRHAYFIKRRIPYLKPINWLMGHTGEVLLNKVPLVKYHEKIYNELTPHKFGGYFNFLSPVIVLRDPELIKNICTKDFEYFMDRTSARLDENDPLSLHLFNLRGQKWKILRTKLTPTFTSGKMKNMFTLMKECAEELEEVINKIIANGESIEAKELMSRYTTDVISSCAFGLQSNSQKDTNSVFRTMGRKIFATNFRRRIIGIISSFSPRLIKMLGLSFFENDIREFFKSIVAKTIKYREETNTNRNDFIDLLISLKKQEILSSIDNTDKGMKMEFTDDLLTAQCFVFFLAGFETSSSTLTFALYELAKHKDFQTKLFNEISEIMNEDKELSYESLQKMIYLDQVINETLRMYPVLPSLVRICNKNYFLDDVLIEKGTRIVIPVMGLHYDPQYYENPQVFNPENFSKKAKDQRHHYVHLPFGEGPRICIGMRFGLNQVKLGLATIIKNYAVSLSPKMNGPLKFNKSSFLPAVEDGIWIIFNRRF